MRVAVFTDTFLPQVNGVSKTLGHMRRNMAEAGIDSLFIAPCSPPEQKGIIVLPGIPLLFYPELSLALPSYLRIQQVLDDFQPDIIHLTTEFTIGWLGLKYARSRGIPITSSYHTNLPQYLNYYHFGALEGLAWRYMRWFHSFSRIIFCPSQATAQLLGEQGFSHLRIMGRGIDEEGFSPRLRSQELRRSWNIPDDHLLLLYVGRLAPEKELEVLLTAFNGIDKPSCHLAVVGDGPLRPELEKRHNQGIIFTGYRSGEDLRRIYASADIFVFPSSTETYGNVVLEAMASGLPVIAPRAGGVKENLIDGCNGFYFNPHDAEDMASAIQHLMDDEPLRLHMGKQAYQHSRSQNWKAVFASVFAAYDELIRPQTFMSIPA